MNVVSGPTRRQWYAIETPHTWAVQLLLNMKRTLQLNIAFLLLLPYQIYQMILTFDTEQPDPTG